MAFILYYLVIGSMTYYFESHSDILVDIRPDVPEFLLAIVEVILWPIVSAMMIVELMRP